MHRVLTGSSFLDDGLGGGLRSGSIFLVEGEAGAGATEFALAVLRATRKANDKARARFATTLRGEPRVRREAEALYDDADATSALEIQVISPMAPGEALLESIGELAAGDVLVIESASPIARAIGTAEFLPFIRTMADKASLAEASILLLHTPGTLAPGDEHALAEAVDGVLSFGWHSGGPTRRRVLIVRKMAGIPPMLNGEQVAILEISLHPGTCFSVSRIKSVV